MDSVKIKTGVVLPLMNLVNFVYTLSDFFTNNQKNYVRLYSDGDGVMHMIQNNLDVKVKFVFPIPNGIEFDRYFGIQEVSKIIQNLVNYAEFAIDGDYIRYRNGHFKITNFDNLPVETTSDYFGAEERVAEQDAIKFNINEDFINETTRIFDILALKSDEHNYFFSSADQIYFGFKYIYVARKCYEQILSTDIFTMKVLYTLLSKFRDQDFYKVIEGKRFYIASDSMYFEGFLIEQEDNDKQFVTNLFDADTYEKIEKINLDNEFYRFLDTVVSFDEKASLIFRGDTVEVNSTIIQDAMITLKESEYEEEFFIMAKDLYRVLKYIYKKKKDIDVLDFHLVHNNLGKFLQYYDGVDTNIALMILS